MPEQYTNVIDIMTSAKKINWEDAVSRLRSKEMDLAGNDPETGEGAYAAQGSKPRRFAEKGQCNYCWEYGHYQAKCPKKKRDKKKKRLANKELSKN